MFKWDVFNSILKHPFIWGPLVFCCFWILHQVWAVDYHILSKKQTLESTSTAFLTNQLQPWAGKAVSSWCPPAACPHRRAWSEDTSPSPSGYPCPPHKGPVSVPPWAWRKWKEGAPTPLSCHPWASADRCWPMGSSKTCRLHPYTNQRLLITLQAQQWRQMHSQDSAPRTTSSKVKTKVKKVSKHHEQSVFLTSCPEPYCTAPFNELSSAKTDASKRCLLLIINQA